MRSAAIAAADYQERVRQFGNRVGMVTHFPVIDRKLDDEAWHAWMRYFRSIGMLWSAKEMRYAERWTVPTKRPEDFAL